MHNELDFVNFYCGCLPISVILERSKLIFSRYINVSHSSDRLLHILAVCYKVLGLQ